MAHKESQLSRLSNARRWLELFEADYPDPEDERQSSADRNATDTLVLFAKTYISELMHSTGLAVEYQSAFERYGHLRGAASSIGEIIRHITEPQARNEKLPPEIAALGKWIFAAGMDMVDRMNAFDCRAGVLPFMLSGTVLRQVAKD